MSTIDKQLQGIWQPSIYVYNGGEYPIQGLMVITPDHLITTATYDLTGNGLMDANANWGTYEIIEPGKMVMQQAMQLHYRNVSEQEKLELAEGDGTFLGINVPEEIHYSVDGDTLTFSFQVPGDQRWVSNRLATGF